MIRSGSGLMFMVLTPNCRVMRSGGCALEDNMPCEEVGVRGPAGTGRRAGLQVLVQGQTLDRDGERRGDGCASFHNLPTVVPGGACDLFRIAQRPASGSACPRAHSRPRRAA